MPAPLALLAALTLLGPETPAPAPARPFAVTVVDEQTGRGVPLVELRTVNEVRYVTDSAGVAAVDEPGLMGRSVFFHVKSHGYEHPADGFGYRGKALTLTEGGGATLKVRRLNVAERLYRVTGAGLYRDSLLTGRAAPVREPLLNAQVFGSDSVLTARYRGKLYWFWGDTNRPGYPLGNFHTPGATSEPPGQGGLDPEAGVDLTYFVDPATGFARPTAAMPGDGPTWLSGLAAFRDEDGRERLVAGYAKVKPTMETYEHGLVAFDPETNAFAKVATFPIDSALRPSGHTFLRKEGETEYIYYCTPYPLTRVRARMADLKDVTRYEGFSPLVTGSRLDRPRLASARLDVDPDRPRQVRYAWRANTPVLTPADEKTLLGDKPAAALLALRDAEAGRPVQAHAGSVYWNAYRNRWVMITVESFGGPSFLGEVWFAEADNPLGPWAYARKVVTHDRYSFYNPLHHPEFDKDGGRVIFFEGTYTITFSGNNAPTPRYDYNQVMYRLDLSDPRLNLPVAFYSSADDTYASGPSAARSAGGSPPAFFALERPGPGTVAVVSTPQGFRAGAPPDGSRPAFHALPADAGDLPKATVPLDDLVRVEGAAGLRVWPAPSSARLPAP
jgi:hypothetical protein